MGTFADTNALADERIAWELDGIAPAVKPAPAPAVVAKPVVAPAPTPVADTGPGFWSRLGSGLADLGGQVADVASRTEIRLAQPQVASAAVVAPVAAVASAEPPWGLIAAGVAAFGLLALLLRR